MDNTWVEPRFGVIGPEVGGLGFEVIYPELIDRQPTNRLGPHGHGRRHRRPPTTNLYLCPFGDGVPLDIDRPLGLFVGPAQRFIH